MTILEVNQGKLFLEMTGEFGQPVVLLHGSLADHRSWARVMPLLAEHARVIAYDRSRHSLSTSSRGQDSILDDAKDLAAVIEKLALGPAHVIGTSGGAAIALRLASSRPELFLSLVAHEPPLIEALPVTAEWAVKRAAFASTIHRFVDILKTEGGTAAAKLFVDEISDGPGKWDGMSDQSKATFARNAWSLYYECHDPEFLRADFVGLSRFDRPILFTQGGRSGPLFSAVIDALTTRALPNAARHIYFDAGHVPHESHPTQLVRTVLGFIGALSPDRR